MTKILNKKIKKKMTKTSLENKIITNALPVSELSDEKRETLKELGMMS